MSLPWLFSHLPVHSVGKKCTGNTEPEKSGAVVNSVRYALMAPAWPFGAHPLTVIVSIVDLVISMYPKAVSVSFITGMDDVSTSMAQILHWFNSRFPLWSTMKIPMLARPNI